MNTSDHEELSINSWRYEKKLFSFFNFFSTLKLFQKNLEALGIRRLCWIIDDDIRQEERNVSSIIADARSLKKEAYPSLIKLACTEEAPLGLRSEAVKYLAIVSKQKFDRDLPEEVRNWQEKDLRLNELLVWEKEGFPEGKGYDKPKQSPALIHPKTPLEIACANLQIKLTNDRLKYYGDPGYDPANPQGLLIIGDEKEIEVVKQTWQLPQVYVEFFENFCPLKVSIERGYQNSLHLLHPTELLEHSAFYNSLPHHLVIAEIADEWIYILDLSQSNGIDAPVFRAELDSHELKFKKYTNSFVGFIKKLTPVKERSFKI